MTGIRNGINVSRRIGNSNNIGEEIRQIRTQGSFPLLQIAVVAEIIYDPNLLTDEQLTNLEDQVVNPRLVAHMPKNSILARLVSNSSDVGDPRSRIIYPFFQSHFELPLKAGEQVFVIYPDPTRDNHEIGYWMTRVPEASSVEDLNFTHGDRRYDQNLNQSNQSTSERSQNETSNNNGTMPNFPNGAGTPETLSLFTTSSSDKPYEKIFNDSNANKQITFEATPRFIKRPAEFALIGSNNSRIVMGEDRTGPATEDDQQKNDKKQKAGAIDIVTGVGGTRFFPTTKDDDPIETDSQKRPTAPRVIDNTRQFKEVDKVPFTRRKQDNPKEGDPDFKRDLSRLYVAMKTAGDKNFNIKAGGDNGIFKNSSDKLNTELVDLPDSDENGQAFIVAKSEHLRFIATGKDPDNGGPTENGDIRIIKEGKESDKDLSMIILNKEGEVITIGKNIQLYTHEEGKIFIRCKNEQPSESDPMILFTKFKELNEEISTKMQALRDGIADQIQSFIQNTIMAPNATSPFGPIPALVAMKAAVASTATQIKAIDIDFTNKIDPCKSKWIFINSENQS